MNFVTAFLAEALPLIEYYQMEKVSGPNCPMYRCEQHTLIISGMGKEKAAGATSFLGQLKEDRSEVWLNLGIAGHGEYDLAEPFLAGKILDDKEREVFFPPQISGDICKVSSLTTCTQPATKYEAGMGYDMEAHAFYQQASRFATRELVQVLKIVSDNPSNPLQKISSKVATQLIEETFEIVTNLVDQLEQLAKEIQPPKSLKILHQKLLNTQHFSATRAHQLYDLIRHTHALGKDLEQLESLVLSAGNAASALSRGQEWLKDSRKMR